jgi:choline dehydrogenase-like flavoprotein
MTGDDRGIADVLIVGAGAAGGVAALRLAEAGLSVVCLEQGDWPDRAQFAGAGPDAELVSGGAWSADPNVRRAAGDYPVDDTDSDMTVINFNGVGGGTVLYSAVWPRLLPVDFRSRTLRGVADDWPISYEELAPYYDRVDRQFGVSGLGGNPAYPPGGDPPLPPLPIGAAGLRIARAHSRLDWHWWPDNNAILSRPFHNRNACVQRGTCALGCVEGAKASTDLTHFRAAMTAGCRVVTGARVLRVTVDAQGLATGAEYVDAEGTVRHQKADVVLLAANGIGTPRLLLASTSKQFLDGLANRSGLVGRRLMLHPLLTVTGIFDEAFAGWPGQNGSSLQSLEFYDSGARPSECRARRDVDFVGSAKWSLHPTGGPLRAALTRSRWGAGHHEHVRQRLGHSCMWAAVCEDLPDPDRRMTLAADLADIDGLPAPAVHYHLDENTRRLLAWHTERATESLEAAGATSVESYPALRNGHLMGTTRMGDDPASSVVDRWNFAHDVPNLGVIDGSVFVTAGGVNPTATIAALALRAADALLDRRALIPRPDHAVSWPIQQRAARPQTPASPAAISDVQLSVEQRAALAALAEEVIPTVPGRLSVQDADVAGVGADAVLAARPDLAAPLLDALGHPFAELRATNRAAYQAAATVVAAAYYRHPDVRAALGVSAEPASPVRIDDFPAYLAEGLLDHLAG